MWVARPAGTVTFLFTDIEGSTRRWEHDPETMAADFAAHDETLRSAIESHGGLFKHSGDGGVRGVLVAAGGNRGCDRGATVTPASLRRSPRNAGRRIRDAGVG
jgi:class 3 adenylate cyclase